MICEGQAKRATMRARRNLKARQGVRCTGRAILSFIPIMGLL